MNNDLPVSKIIPSLLKTLEKDGMALLEAPPGAGKSTLVPPAILESGLAGKKKIYLLEPRRLAARSLASHISSLLNDKVGGICGYRVHRETKISSRTQIEVITEGVLIRILQSDPALEEGAVVIFDEFHERNLLSDLALSLLLEVKEGFREDLFILFMSATPDRDSLTSLIPNIPIVRSEGRQFPVEVEYREAPASRCINRSVIREALKETDGDILVFLPGEREILFWESSLRADLKSDFGDVEIYPLYGRLSLERQNHVITLHGKGERRIVLATSIAETSLTIPGVTAVVDLGLVRRPVYNSSSGLTMLETGSISMASAEQRKGRAGRVCPGVCYRLWDQKEEALRDKQTEPEILQADLAPLVLEVARWGCFDPTQMKWLTTPPGGAWFGAVALLKLLGALDGQGRLTKRGESMVTLPTHPRLANLLLYGIENDLSPEAALLAAYLGQRDFLPTNRGSDIMARLEYLCGSRSPGEYSRGIHQIWDEAKHMMRLLPGDKTASMGRGKNNYMTFLSQGATLLAQAFPDRIAQKIDEGLYQLSGGGRIQLRPSDPLVVNHFLVAAHCGGVPQRQRLYLGIAIEKGDLEEIFFSQITQEREGRWQKDKRRVSFTLKRRLGELSLSETPQKIGQDSDITSLMQKTLRQGGVEILPWDKESRRLYERMLYVEKQRALSLKKPGKEKESWPDLTSEGLAENVELWLTPYFSQGRLDVKLSEPLKGLLNWEQKQELDRVAPESHLSQLGNRRKIEYGQDSPYLPIPLQEMYGTEQSPLLGEQRLTLHLLNPAGRPVQITSDLESFWSNSWASVRSELKGRYPKHFWPENPSESQASLSTGKRRPKS